MEMPVKQILVTILFALNNSAARPQRSAVLPSPSAGKSLICVYRQGRVWAPIDPYPSFYLDHEFLAKLRYNNYAVREVSPGKLLIRAASFGSAGRLAVHLPARLPYQSSCTGLDSDHLDAVDPGYVAGCVAELRKALSSLTAMFSEDWLTGDALEQVPICRINPELWRDQAPDGQHRIYDRTQVGVCQNSVIFAIATLTDRPVDWQRAGFTTFELQVEAGKTYYVKWTLSKSSLARPSRPGMTLVDEATGANEIRGMRLGWHP